MTSTYNKETHSLKEIPEMEIPEWTGNIMLDEDNQVEYEKELSLCKTYPVSGEVPQDWVGRDIIEGKDYKIEGELAIPIY